MELFRAFGVEQHVKYSKITSYSEEAVARKGDIRELTKRLLTGEVPASTGIASPFGLRPVIPGLQALCDHQASEVLAQRQADSLELVSCSSLPRASESVTDVQAALPAFEAGPFQELPAGMEEILLVDEVDVFFGDEFYGETYNVTAQLEVQEVQQILILIYENRQHMHDVQKLLNIIHGSAPYKALLAKFPGWEAVLTNEVLEMCYDLQRFEEPRYHYDPHRDQIGYQVMDSLCFDLIYGYRTAFAYLKHSPRNVEANVQRALQLRISCGRFSYANVQPACMLGVSGTLEALSASEWQVMSKYGFKSFSLVPSVYGPNNFRFLDQAAGSPITVTDSAENYHLAITNEITQKLGQERAIIVFFKDGTQLEKYLATNYARSLPSKNLLLESQSHSEKEFAIKRAATASQVTLTTAVFGRGTDFVCNDDALLKAGGVHIVQGFIANAMSEEKQIQGRTARQGKDGSYSMILEAQDLQDHGISPAAAATMQSNMLYESLRKAVEKKCADVAKLREEKLAVASSRDAISHSLLDALVAGNTKLAKEKLLELKDYQQMKRGRRASGQAPAFPEAGGRVHFTGLVMSDAYEESHFSVPYKVDKFGEYVGVGQYPSNKTAFPKSIATTFDAVAVDAGTRVVIYSEPNFKGQVLWDKVGPAIIFNSKWKGTQKYAPELTRTWSQPLQTIFPPSVREWSVSDMHLWDHGSLVIEDGEPIPQRLKDLLPEYGRLSNATY